MSAIHINLASKEELTSLRGIGDATAARIVKLRGSEGQIQLQALVGQTNIGVQNWAAWVKDGTIVLDLSPDDRAVLLPTTLHTETSPGTPSMETMMLQMMKMMSTQQQVFQESFLKAQAEQSRQHTELLRALVTEVGPDKAATEKAEMDIRAQQFQDRLQKDREEFSHILGAFPAGNIYKNTTSDIKSDPDPHPDGTEHTNSTRTKTNKSDRKHVPRSPVLERTFGESSDNGEEQEFSEEGEDDESNEADSEQEEDVRDQDQDRRLPREHTQGRSGNRGRPHNYYGDRPRSPPPPKMATFHGETQKWDSFIFQFRELANAQHWGPEKKLQRLKLCLRDKAVEYLQTRPKAVRQDYYKLKKALASRYGQKDPPITIRRLLASLRQEEDENIEEFADRTLSLTIKGHPRASDEVIQTMATEVFLRGCKGRYAALMAAEKDLPTIYRALRYVKSSVHNQKALGKPSVIARQVTFDDELAVRSVESVSGTIASKNQMGDIDRISTKLSNDLSGVLDRQFSKLLNQLEKLTHPGQKSISGSPRSFSRSPSPQSSRRSISPSSPKSDLCYSCQKKGHFARDCPFKSQKFSSPSSTNSTESQFKRLPVPHLNS